MSRFTAPIDFVKHDFVNDSLIIRTTAAVAFESDRYGNIIIPNGSISDGASIPRIFWSIFSPFDGDYFDAAVLHDVIYRDRNTRFQRHEADLIFLDAMKTLGVGWIKRSIIYRAVRLGGGKPWRESRI